MEQCIKEIRFGPPFNVWKPEITAEAQEHGFYLHVAITVPNTDNGEATKFVHSFPYFYFPTINDFQKIVICCIKQVVLHELGESLWIGNERPLYPHLKE